MVRSIFTVTTVLVVLSACHDGPAQLIDPMDGRAGAPNEVTASAESMRTVIELMNDPFVRELQGAVMLSTEPLDRAVRDVSRYGTPNDMLTLARILAATTSRLIPGEDDVQETEDDMVLRTALALMLDDARKLLDEPTQSRGEGLGVSDLNTRNPK